MARTGYTYAFWAHHKAYCDKWYRKNAKGENVWVCWQDGFNTWSQLNLPLH